MSYLASEPIFWITSLFSRFLQAKYVVGVFFVLFSVKIGYLISRALCTCKVLSSNNDYLVFFFLQLLLCLLTC